MKKTVKILSLFLALIFVLSTLVACELGTNQPAAGKTMVTIQWVQGQRVLKEEVYL